MKRSHILMALIALASASLACGAAAATPTAGAITNAHAQEPASCDSPADPLGPGQYTRHIDATSEAYPANCDYYCTNILPGATSLDVAVYNFTEDLDVFVGLGEITSVRGVPPEKNPWKSNTLGLGEERVTVSPADAGTYYIEVCSFGFNATNYQIEIAAP